MEILRSEQFEHEGNDCMIYDNLLLYEMGRRFVVSWNGFKIGWFGCKTSNDMSVFNTLEEATKEFKRMLKVLSWQHNSFML